MKNLLLFTAQFVNPCFQIFPFTFNCCVPDFQIQLDKKKNVGVYKTRDKTTTKNQQSSGKIFRIEVGGMGPS